MCVQTQMRGTTRAVEQNNGGQRKKQLKGERRHYERTHCRAANARLDHQQVRTKEENTTGSAKCAEHWTSKRQKRKRRTTEQTRS